MNMEFIKRFFVSSPNQTGTNEDNPLENFEKSKLLAGPPQSGRSSLLFELAFTYAEQGKKVVFITTKVLRNLPLLLIGREQPPVETLDNIHMIYLETKSELLQFMASVHIKYKEPVDIFIVDDIDHYYIKEAKKTQLASQAKVFAFVLDAVSFMNDLSKRQPSPRACHVVCSIATQNDKDVLITQQDFFERWFKEVALIKPISTSERKFMLLKMPISENQETSSPLSISYKFENQRIKAIENDAND